MYAGMLPDLALDDALFAKHMEHDQQHDQQHQRRDQADHTDDDRLRRGGRLLLHRDLIHHAGRGFHPIRRALHQRLLRGVGKGLDGRLLFQPFVGVRGNRHNQIAIAGRDRKHHRVRSGIERFQQISRPSRRLPLGLEALQVQQTHRDARLLFGFLDRIGDFRDIRTEQVLRIGDVVGDGESGSRVFRIAHRSYPHHRAKAQQHREQRAKRAIVTNPAFPPRSRHAERPR